MGLAACGTGSGKRSGDICRIIHVEPDVIDHRRHVNARRLDELLHARSAHGAIELAANLQHRVVQLLSIEARMVHAPMIMVVRIGFRKRVIVS